MAEEKVKVTELEDGSLEDVSGGAEHGGGCVVNTVAGCGC
jgi:hypothetical protein